MFNIGPPELIVILLVALLVVGPKRLPEVGKTIGRSLREFRKAQDDLKSSFNFDVDGDATSKPAAKKPVETPAKPEEDPGEDRVTEETVEDSTDPGDPSQAGPSEIPPDPADGN